MTQVISRRRLASYAADVLAAGGDRGLLLREIAAYLIEMKATRTANLVVAQWVVSGPNGRCRRSGGGVDRSRPGDVRAGRPLSGRGQRRRRSATESDDSRASRT